MNRRQAKKKEKERKQEEREFLMELQKAINALKEFNNHQIMKGD